MSSIEIERAVNGFELSYSDPEIEKKNQQSGAKWVNPRREMVFTSSADLLKALKSIIDSMPAYESFDTAFDAAIKASKMGDSEDD